jgi:hypothetical protein
MRFHLRSIAAIAVSAGVVLFLTACKIPAAELDPASAIRGSLGVSLDDLSLTDYFGRVAFLLGGGFALLWGAIAGFAFISRHRRRGPRSAASQPEFGLRSSKNHDLGVPS